MTEKNKKPSIQAGNMKKPSPEELKKLLLAQMKAGGGMAGGLPGLAKPTRTARFLNFAVTKSQAVIKFIDSFIGFVTRAEDKDRDEVMQWSRAPILFGMMVFINVIGFGGFWSAFAPLDSATAAIGTVIANTKKKVIQHQEGGMIKKILVAEGDHVKEGEPVLELDDVRAKSNYEEIVAQYRTLLANHSRLEAERDNLPSISYNSTLLKDSHLPDVDKIIKTQNKLFIARQEGFNAYVKAAEKKSNQERAQIEGSKGQVVTLKKGMDIVEEGLDDPRKLYDEKFVQKTQLQEFESQKAQIDGQIAELHSTIARLEQEIHKSDMELVHHKNEYLGKIVSELKDTQTNLLVVYEKYVAAKDVLDRTIIRSPVDGTVNNVNVHTIGAIIHPQYEILEILPEHDHLIIEAKISPKDIASVAIGLNAKVRFSAFKSRTTPVFTGKVISLSADVVEDKTALAQRGMAEPYSYIAKIEIDMEEFNNIAKVYNLKLNPGMAAEVQIVTGTRTLLRYLLDPVMDNMFKAFIEK